MLKDLDPSKNGYVTSLELEEIFKQVYPKQLARVSLTKVLQPFASIQNKLLIDYARVIKALNHYLVRNGEQKEDPEELVIKVDAQAKRLDLTKLRPSVESKETEMQHSKSVASIKPVQEYQGFSSMKR